MNFHLIILVFVKFKRVDEYKYNNRDFNLAHLGKENVMSGRNSQCTSWIYKLSKYYWLPKQGLECHFSQSIRIFYLLKSIDFLRMYLVISSIIIKNYNFELFGLVFWKNQATHLQLTIKWLQSMFQNSTRFREPYLFIHNFKWYDIWMCT